MAEILEPQVDYIYRGFLIRLPASFDQLAVSKVRYQYRVSNDDSIFTDWDELAETYKSSSFSFIHDGLVKDSFYQYRMQVYYKTGAISDWSDYAAPGNGTQIADYSGIDQAAASLGTISSGYLRGVIFETSPNYPKVRMDPTGFYALSTTATPVFINSQTGDATFGGTINATGGVFTGTVSGGVFIGSTFVTNSGLSRMTLATPGLIAYDSSGNKTSELPNSGGLIFNQIGTGVANIIKWLSAGTTVAQQQVIVSGGKNTSSQVSFPGGGDDAQSEVLAYNSGSTDYAQVASSYHSGEAGGDYKAYARASTSQYRNIVTSIGRSDFLQVGGNGLGGTATSRNRIWGPWLGGSTTQAGPDAYIDWTFTHNLSSTYGVSTYYVLAIPEIGFSDIPTIGVLSKNADTAVIRAQLKGAGTLITAIVAWFISTDG